MAFLWATLHPSRSSAGMAFVSGMTFGLAAYVVGYGWLWGLVGGFFAGQQVLSVSLWFIHGLWFAVGFGLHSLLVNILLRRGVGWTLAAVSSLVAVQWLQPQLFSAELGAGLMHAPWLAQTAELGGPLLLTAWVAGVNASVWSMASRGLRCGWKLYCTTGIATAFVVTFGAIRSQPAPVDSPRISVGIVQANLAPTADITERIRAHRTYLKMSRQLVDRHSLDLLVWPESAYGPSIRLPLPVAGHGIRPGVGVPLLFGATALENESGQSRSSNAVFLIDGDGMIRSVYRKRLLIPFAEYLPFASVYPELRAWFPYAQGFSAGDGDGAVTWQSWRIATPVCYEAIHAGFVRNMVREHRPHLIVTLANDAWFGDSQEPHIHLTLARLRAIEHRKWIVRATNSGISAVIDPRGYILERTPLMAPATLHGNVQLDASTTLYTRLGDWPGWLALLAVIGGWLSPWWAPVRTGVRFDRDGANGGD